VFFLSPIILKVLSISPSLNELIPFLDIAENPDLAPSINIVISPPKSVNRPECMAA